MLYEFENEVVEAGNVRLALIEVSFGVRVIVVLEPRRKFSIIQQLPSGSLATV